MRVIEFKPFGFPKEPDTVGKPTFLVAVVPFEDFPYDSMKLAIQSPYENHYEINISDFFQLQVSKWYRIQTNFNS